MPKDFYPELTALLHAADWRRVGNAKGSHERWRHPDKTKTVFVKSLPRTEPGDGA